MNGCGARWDNWPKHIQEVYALLRCLRLRYREAVCLLFGLDGKRMNALLKALGAILGVSGNGPGRYRLQRLGDCDARSSTLLHDACFPIRRGQDR
jgi:hypothetical protein